MTPNPHSIVLKASYSSDPNLFTDSTTFQLTITDSCQTTALTRATAITDMTTSILVQVTQDASMQDTASKTLGNLDGTTLCGLRTYSMVIRDSSNTVVTAAATGISINYSTGLITLNPNSPPITNVGSYTAEITTTLASYSSITDKKTINIEINPCQVTSITHSTTLANVIFVNLVDTSLGPYTYPTYTQVPACNYGDMFAIQVNAVTQASPYVFLTYSQTSYTVATSDVLLEGTTHAMTLVYSLTSYSYTTVASDSTMTWTVQIMNTCVNSVLDEISAFATMTTSVAGATITQAFTNVKDTISKTYDTTATSYAVTSNGPPVVTSGPLKGTTFCGLRSYVITGGASCAALTLTYNASPYYPVLNLVSTDPTQVTASTLCTVTATLPDHTTVPAVTKTVNVVIQACLITSFTQDAGNPQSQTYTMMATVLSVPFPTFTQTPACNYVITYTCQVDNVASDYTTNANIFSMSNCDTTNKLFTVNIEKGGTLTTLTAQIAKASNYQIYVTATLDNSPATIMNAFNFMLTVVNPCSAPTIIDNASYLMQSMTSSVKLASQPVTQTITAYQDSVSKLYGNKDGASLCGTRQYAVTQIVAGSSSAFSIWFTQPTAATSANNQVSVNTQNDVDIGYIPCNTMRLTVSLTSYSNVTPITQDFNICIYPCAITNFVANSVVPNLSKIILTDPAATVNFPSYTQTPACGYPVVLTGTSNGFALPDALNAPFVTSFGPSSWVVYGSNLNQAGTKNMVLTATLTPHSYYPIQSNSDVAWTLTFASACLTTAVNGNLIVVPNLANSVKAATVTYSFTAYIDSLSQTFNGGVSMCGLTTYTLAGAYPGTGTWMNFDSLSRTITVQTGLDSDIKFTPTGYAVTIKGCLDDYPTVCSTPQTFYVSINACEVTSITANPTTLPNLVYTQRIDSSIGPITFPSYTQVPACGYAYTLTMQVNSATQASGYLFLTYTQTDYTVANTNDALQGIRYPMTLIYTLLSYTYATVKTDSSVNWNVDIQACVITSFTLDTANLPTYTYTMMQTAPFFVPFSTYSQTPACGYTYTYTCQVIVAGVESDITTDANLNSMATCDTSGKQLTINIEKGGTLTSLTAQIAKAGSYQIQITATLNDPLVTKNILSSYMLTVVNPCDLPNTIDSSTNIMQDMTSSVKLATQPVIQTFNAYQDSASKLYGNADGLTLCGLRTYAVTQTVARSASAFSTWLTQPTAATNAGSQVSVNSQSDSDMGYSPCNTMRLTVALQSYPSVQITQDFNICIYPCVITNFQENSAIADLSMEIFFDPAATVTFPAYTQTPACGYLITFSGTITAASVTVLPSATIPFVTTFDQLNYVVYTGDLLFAGIYPMTLTATLNQSYYPTYSNSDVTWTLTLVDPCVGTVVNGNSVVVADMLYSVKNVITTQQIFDAFLNKVVIDSTAIAIAPQQPLSCGPTSYTLGGAYTGSNSWIQFTQATRTIDVATASDADIKYNPTGYAVTITACLDKYPPPDTLCFGPQTFYVKIVPCQITLFEIQSPMPNFTYNIFQTTNVQWLSPYVQTPLCNYQQTYSATVQLAAGTPGDYTTFPWISIIPTTKTPPFGLEPGWTVYSQTATDEGAYTVVQTVTLNDVYWPALTTLSVSFVITLVDPCKTPTTITPQNGAGQTFDSSSNVALLKTSVKFGTDVGSGTAVTFRFNFHDDVISSSLRVSNPLIAFVCGPRKYTLTFDPANTAGTQFQSVDSTIPQLSIMTNNDLDIGVHKMMLTVELLNYPLIVRPIYEFFNIQIDSCIVKLISFLPAGGYVPSGNSAIDPIIVNIFDTSSQYLSGAVFTQTPLCDYPVQYTQQLVPRSGGPPEQKKWDQILKQMVNVDTVAPSFSLISTIVTPYQFEWKSQTAEDDKCVYGVADPLGVVDKRAYDPLNINPYYMNLVAKLQNNPVPPNNVVNPNSLAILNDAIKFYIWPKDPCYQATLNSAVPLTMLTFVNSTLPATQSLTTTKDTVSISVGSSTQDDYCGARTYTVKTLSDAPVKYFTVNNGPPPIIKLATQNPYDAGIKTLVFSTQLNKYPFITTTAQFQAMIFYLEPCNLIGEKYYQVGTDELALTFSPYQIQPANVTYSIEYQLRVTTLVKNGTGDTFRSNYPNLPKWVNFDPLQRNIVIFTNDATYFGNYTMQIVGKVTQYDFVESISEFLLHIILTPPPPQPNDPPFFVETLKNGDFFWGDTWSYQLPKTDDHEGDKITQRILQKPDWLKYDAVSKTFSVDQGATGFKQVGYYTVRISLTDTTTATQEYKFLVEIKPLIVVIVPYEDPNKNRPKPVIDSINPKGLVTITWSKSMKTPRNLTYLQTENTTYNDLESNILDQKVPVLDVKVLRSKSSRDQKNLNFTWEIKSFQQKTLLIQLWFADPYQVSYENLPEELLFIFYEEDQFVGKEFGLPCKIGPEYNITKKIPPQVSPKAIKKVRTANNKMASTLATVGNVITQLMLSATLNQLWSLINTQQLIVMIPLFKITLPENAAGFFAYVMQIAAFDVVPTDDIFGFIFSQPVDNLPDALNSNFDAVGFSTIYFFNNMGSLIFGLMSSPILAVVAKILFVFKQYPKFIRRAKKIERGIYWGSTLRVMLESYTVMVVCCAIQSTNYGFDSTNAWGPILYSAVSVFYFAVCFVLPFFQAIFCYKNFDKLDDEKFEQKWGVLWEGMRINEKGFITYNFIFLMRRLWLALSVVYSREILFFQVAGLIFQIIISCIVTGQTRPFEDKRTNDMEFFNEVMIMFVLYNFMCFTDWQPDEKVQYYQGYIACGVTLTHIGVNLILMAQENIRLAALRYKKYRSWKGYAKVRSEGMHQMQKVHRDQLFYKSRKFKIVDAANNIVAKRRVNENLESIEEIENSWRWEDQSGPQHVSYDYVKAEESKQAEEHSLSKSIEHEEQSLNGSDHKVVMAQICKQPEEAPKITTAEVSDPVNEQHREQNKLLGEKRRVDPILGMEQNVHAKLGMKVGPDTVVPDPRAIMDSLWGLDNSTQFQLNKQPAAEPKMASHQEPTGLQAKLARRAAQDIGSIPQVKEDPNLYHGHLKLQANKDSIHSKLFRQVERGDGPKAPQRAFTESEVNEITQAKAQKAVPRTRNDTAKVTYQDDGKFERVVSEILDKPEKAKPARDIFGEMEFDFGI